MKPGISTWLIILSVIQLVTGTSYLRTLVIRTGLPWDLRLDLQKMIIVELFNIFLRIFLRTIKKAFFQALWKKIKNVGCQLASMRLTRTLARKNLNDEFGKKKISCCCCCCGCCCCCCCCCCFLRGRLSRSIRVPWAFEKKDSQKDHFKVLRMLDSAIFTNQGSCLVSSNYPKGLKNSALGWSVMKGVFLYSDISDLDAIQWRNLVVKTAKLVLYSLIVRYTSIEVSLQTWS